MVKNFNRKIVLEDGSEYYGYAFGSTEDKVTELVFDTSMISYQEILSDPAYANQTVVMTYTLIGNYGIADEDLESKDPCLGGLVVREYNDYPSNFRYTKTLGEEMEENKIPGIYGLDTRKLTRAIRNNGTCKVLMTAADTPKEEALRILSETPLKNDAVSSVSCKKRRYSRTPNPRYNVVAIDCGIRSSSIRALNSAHCNVTVVPYNTSYEEIVKMNPDGVFVSDGPGNPNDVQCVIDVLKQLKGKYPMFGCGLGHQLIALAFGGQVEKLKFGHHGGNHPVRNLANGKIEIVTQNHLYTVNAESLSNTTLKVTHENVLDGTVEGLRSAEDRALCVQYHPEGANGSEAIGLYEQFIAIMEEGK